MEGGVTLRVKGPFHASQAAGPPYRGLRYVPCAETLALFDLLKKGPNISFPISAPVPHLLYFCRIVFNSTSSPRSNKSPANSTVHTLKKQVLFCYLLLCFSAQVSIQQMCGEHWISVSTDPLQASWFLIWIIATACSWAAHPLSDYLVSVDLKSASFHGQPATGVNDLASDLGMHS